MSEKKHLIFYLIFLLLIPSATFGFNHETRIGMIADALAFMPPDLRSFLQPNRKIIEEGVSYADRWPQVHSRPGEIEILYSALIRALKRIPGEGGEGYEILRRFGLLACHIAETIYPGMVYTADDLIPARVTYDGLQEISDARDRIGILIQSFREPYRASLGVGDLQFLYTVAVNEIADFWISAWKADRSISGLLAVGTEIEHRPPVEKKIFLYSSPAAPPPTREKEAGAAPPAVPAEEKGKTGSGYTRSRSR